MKIRKKLLDLFVISVVIFLCGCVEEKVEKTTTSTTKMTLTTTTTSVAPLAGVSFEDIFNLGKPEGYTIVYDISVSAAGEMNEITQTHYLSGREFRLDTGGEVLGVETEMRVYNLVEGTYVCSKIEDIWNCIGGKTPEEEEYGFDLGGMTSQIEEDITKPIHDGTQVVAGVTAQCFRATVSEGSMRYCLHPDYYMPLLVESTGVSMGQEGYFRMEATSVTLGAPSDSIFELPAEPMDLSGMCRQACMQMPEEYREDCLESC